jgi:hypothetical protein
MAPFDALVTVSNNVTEANRTYYFDGNSASDSWTLNALNGDTIRIQASFYADERLLNVTWDDEALFEYDFSCRYLAAKECLKQPSCQQVNQYCMPVVFAEDFCADFANVTGISRCQDISELVNYDQVLYSAVYRYNLTTFTGGQYEGVLESVLYVYDNGRMTSSFFYDNMADALKLPGPVDGSWKVLDFVGDGKSMVSSTMPGYFKISTLIQNWGNEIDNPLYGKQEFSLLLCDDLSEFKHCSDLYADAVVTVETLDFYGACYDFLTPDTSNTSNCTSCKSQSESCSWVAVNSTHNLCVFGGAIGSDYDNATRVESCDGSTDDKPNKSILPYVLAAAGALLALVGMCFFWSRSQNEVEKKQHTGIIQEDDVAYASLN